METIKETYYSRIKRNQYSFIIYQNIVHHLKQTTKLITTKSLNKIVSNCLIYVTSVLNHGKDVRLGTNFLLCSLLSLHPKFGQLLLPLICYLSSLFSLLLQLLWQKNG